MRKKNSIALNALTFMLPAALCAYPMMVITELQRDPEGGESSMPGGASHEFVEITNLGTDTVMLDSLCITDGVEPDSVVPWPSPLPLHLDCITGSLALAPGASALVLDRDYPPAVDSAPSSRLPIRPGTLLLCVNDAEIGSGLAADDGVIVYKGTRAVIARTVCFAADSVSCGSDPRAGKVTLTEPRGAPEGFSAVPVSFLFDTAARYGVCGDSLTPGCFELLRNGWAAEARFGLPDTLLRTFSCTLACFKSGTLPEPPVEWRVRMSSASYTVTAAQGTCVLQGSRAGAAFPLPLDSLSYSLCLVESDTETVWPLDVSSLWLPAAPLRISELFPRSNAGEPEWFELVNMSGMPVNLNGWTFGNDEGSDTVVTRDLVVTPGAYLVIAADSRLFRLQYPAKQDVLEPARWHSLGNYSDTLCLWDAHGCLRERVCWQSSWFTDWTGQSLERVSLSNSGMDAASWALAHSPTPGQPNGCSTWRGGAVPRLEAGPLPFSPNGDGRDDCLSILVELPAGHSAIVSIYGFSGKRLYTFSGPLSGRFSWNGRTDNGSPAPVGPFFVVMETKSSTGTVILRRKGVLWR